jgi:predicted DNA-binding protein
LKTKGDPIYSPKIPDDLIPALYKLGKKTGKPMTKVVDRMIEDGIKKYRDNAGFSYRAENSPLLKDTGERRIIKKLDKVNREYCEKRDKLLKELESINMTEEDLMI